MILKKIASSMLALGMFWTSSFNWWSWLPNNFFDFDHNGGGNHDDMNGGHSSNQRADVDADASTTVHSEIHAISRNHISIDQD